MKRVLIANRGEIALRIHRACKQLGLETVAAYTKADKELFHLDLVDDRICVGQQSYLDANQLISAAQVTGCDAIHPGYGFLSEDAAFAAEVTAAGLTFVGPDAAHIALMGDKIEARRAFAGAGVPTLPGSDKAIEDEHELRRIAETVGFPVMLKAAHGGGGMGIQLAGSEPELVTAFQTLSQQADVLFGSAEMYLEKYLVEARHIEIQVFGDGAGGVTCFGARECSIQRRHQKLLEETPPPGIPPAIIEELAQTCCQALGEMRYASAGTLEFLYADEAFFFIEMNTRIQVEHPVTEAVFGVDLVKMQLQLAAGQPVLMAQADIQGKGHALECRINAEDESFNPSPGRITRLRFPGGPGIRVDSQLYEGYSVPHHYDSLVAKIIAWGSDRQDAIARMSGALAELDIRGISTNVPLHQKILVNQAFRAGRYHTGLLDGS